MCITITIWHTGSGDDAVIGYTSSIWNGNYAEGSQAWGWGGYPALSDQEYLETVAIPGTMSYLQVPKTFICGYETYDCTNLTCVENTTDGNGQYASLALCETGCKVSNGNGIIPPENALLYAAGVAVILVAGVLYINSQMME